ncbi:MAG: type II secretion system F family protein [Thermoprotei archaeon]|nr:type II secretion system F family protein [Thermoprotei archaeon]
MSLMLRVKRALSGLMHGSEIESEFLFFLLYLRSLATSEITRLQLFSLTAEKDAFRAIAMYMGQVKVLVEKWRYGQADACEAIARKIPSPRLRDFLIRFAQSIRAGEPLISFLTREFDGFMRAYPEDSLRRTNRLRHLSDAYSAIFTSGVFLSTMSFLAATLVFMQFSIPLLVSVVTGTALGMSFIAVLIYRVARPDGILVKEKMKSRSRRALEVGIVLSLVSSSLLFFTFSQRSLALGVMFLGLPLFIEGSAGKLYVRLVKQREEVYPVFIRNLVSYIAGGVAIMTAMKNALIVNYGKLAPMIRRLYAKLKLRIDPRIAWRSFEVEVGSELIRRMDAVLVDTLYQGGDAEEVGRLMDHVYTEYMAARSRRYRVVSYFQGMLVPVHIAMSALLGMMEAFFKLLFEYMQLVSNIIPVGYIPPLSFIGIYFLFILVLFSLTNTLALYFMEGDSRYSLLFYMGLFLVGGSLAYQGLYWATESFLSSIRF